LVDDHTDYFKSNIESLPPTERKVFACLAGIWEEATAAEVGMAARLTPSKASALLNRLEGRGAVTVVEQDKGKKKYQLSERLYNIYYLMRRGQDSGRVKAVVNFMVQFYGKQRLHEAAADIAREACGLDCDWRKYSYLAVRVILERPEAKDYRPQILAAIPREFFLLPDFPDYLPRPEEASNFVDHNREEVGLSAELLRNYEEGNWEEYVRVLREMLATRHDITAGWALLGAVLSLKLSKHEEGVECLRKAVELSPEDSFAWAILGDVLSRQLGKPEEGIEYMHKAVELKPDVAWAWAILGNVLSDQLAKPEEGVECLQKAVALKADDAWTWGVLGEVQSRQLGKPKEGAECLRKAVALKPDYAWAWAMLGEVLSRQLDDPVEGVECLRKSVELKPDSTEVWVMLGKTLLMLGHADKETFLEMPHSKEGEMSNEASVLEGLLVECGRLPSVLNSFACHLMDLQRYEALVTIESWAREAVDAHDDGQAYYHGTLSRVLALRGKVAEALEHVAVVLEQPEVVRGEIQEPTDVLTTAAAAGWGQKALEILLASPSLPLLEPLVAGLKRYLGLEVKAPQEVKEVAEDVVKRIEHWKQWHAERGTIFELSKPE